MVQDSHLRSARPAYRFRNTGESKAAYSRAIGVLETERHGESSHREMRYFLTLLGFAFFFSSSALALGPLSIGVKGGVSITDAFSDTTQSGAGISQRTFSDSNDYIVGPMVELRLPFGIGAEADALYRPLHLTTQINRASSPNGTITTSGSISSWEFPILAKYRTSFPIVHPYIEAGPSFRSLGGNLDSYMSKVGVTAGAGIEVNALLLRVAPEFRYTHWGSDSTAAPGAFQASSNQNQVEFLVGLSF